MKNIKEITDIFKQEIKKKYTPQTTMPIYIGVSDMEIILEEIERLNNIINELNTAYCKVITKCEEMIDSRFYMNDIAIKKYADEIKDICKYYVREAKELKGEKE